MPTQSGCTLCGGNDHARSECSWSGAHDERQAFEAAYAKYQGIAEKTYPLWFERHGDGYTSSSVHASWWGWKQYPEWQRTQSAPAGAVPDGWRLVPVEPTPEMLQAGADEPLAGDHDDDAPEDYRAVFKAMLAAAPQPAPHPLCQTCDDNGRIGGPSFYAPDEGGEPCPDCTQPAAQSVMCHGCFAQGVESDHFDAAGKCKAMQPAPQQGDDIPTGYDNLWRWFGMSYATWLTLPRVLMHAMPDDWQGQMADLLEQWDQAWNTGHLPLPEVTAKEDGKYTSWPAWVLNYRHPDQAAIEAVRAQGEGERT